ALIVTSSILVILAINEREDLSREKPLSRDGLSFHVMLHIALRSSFLVSYECFFRGCVLFSCIEFFGTAPAIIINLILYALIHSFNGKKEMYGAIPFGLMLCLFTIWYQSVWPAILLHLLLTSLHESFILSSLFCKKSTPVL
ncbi:MAG: CPBP family intramembrane glutamic endopeptidase, partial [Chitinophagaceae bacterium]